MDKQPLNYEPKPPRNRGPWWLWLFAAAAYGIGGFLCRGHPFGDIFATMEIVTMIVAVVSAVALGIHYGTQDKDYW